MRNADTVLGIIRERGKRGLILEDVYRQLFNPDLYLRAYGRIYRNAGAMTKGTTQETADGMSRGKIGAIIDLIRHERYRWTPVRRVLIPKTNGKMRPLGIPTWSDKLVQEVIRSVLEAYYEPQFSRSSHGFRPDLGCHTALCEIQHVWHGTKWFIEGDIKGCFDNIDHAVLMSILGEKIHDSRFLILIESLLKAGYLEGWNYHHTYSGTPQGGIVSPILANIYLDRLDKFVETTLIPKFKRGKTRRPHRERARLTTKAWYLSKKGMAAEAAPLTKIVKTLPSADPHDPDYRRLKFIRYADDFLLGFAGPKVEAEEIKTALTAFLRDHLKLELSEEKTLITHANQMAKFLGYEVTMKRSAENLRLNGVPALRIPSKVIDTICSRYQRGDISAHRSELINNNDFDIVNLYGSEYRGIVQYYRLAENVRWLTRVHWHMRGSLLKTLAAKHRSTVPKMLRKYQDIYATKFGLLKCMKVVIRRQDKPVLTARFGGEPLRRDLNAPVRDERYPTHVTRTELIQRLLADRCENCGSSEDVEVHHIRKLADLNRPGRKAISPWKELMIARKRKTLVLCHDCHVDLHAGRPMRRPRNATGEPCALKVARTVRRGADGKGVAVGWPSLPLQKDK